MRELLLLISVFWFNLYAVRGTIVKDATLSNIALQTSRKSVNFTFNINEFQASDIIFIEGKAIPSIEIVQRLQESPYASEITANTKRGRLSLDKLIQSHSKEAFRLVMNNQDISLREIGVMLNLNELNFIRPTHMDIDGNSMPISEIIDMYAKDLKSSISVRYTNNNEYFFKDNNVISATELYNIIFQRPNYVYDFSSLEMNGMKLPFNIIISILSYTPNLEIILDGVKMPILTFTQKSSGFRGKLQLKFEGIIESLIDVFKKTLKYTIVDFLTLPNAMVAPYYALHSLKHLSSITAWRPGPGKQPVPLQQFLLDVFPDEDPKQNVMQIFSRGDILSVQKLVELLMNEGHTIFGDMTYANRLPRDKNYSIRLGNHTYTIETFLDTYGRTSEYYEVLLGDKVLTLKEVQALATSSTTIIKHTTEISIATKFGLSFRPSEVAYNLAQQKPRHVMIVYEGISYTPEQFVSIYRDGMPDKFQIQKNGIDISFSDTFKLIDINNTPQFLKKYKVRDISYKGQTYTKDDILIAILENPAGFTILDKGQFMNPINFKEHYGDNVPEYVIYYKEKPIKPEDIPSVLELETILEEDFYPILYNGNTFTPLDVVKMLANQQPDAVKILHKEKTYSPEEYVISFPSTKFQVLYNDYPIKAQDLDQIIDFDLKFPQSKLRFIPIKYKGKSYTKEDILELLIQQNPPNVKILHEGVFYLPKQFVRKFGKSLPVNFAVVQNNRIIPSKLLPTIIRLGGSPQADPKIFPNVIYGGKEYTSDDILHLITTQNPDDVTIAVRNKQFTPKQFEKIYDGVYPITFTILFKNAVVSPEEIANIVDFDKLSETTETPKLIIYTTARQYKTPTTTTEMSVEIDRESDTIFRRTILADMSTPRPHTTSPVNYVKDFEDTVGADDRWVMNRESRNDKSERHVEPLGDTKFKVEDIGPSTDFRSKQFPYVIYDGTLYSPTDVVRSIIDMISQGSLNDTWTIQYEDKKYSPVEFIKLHKILPREFRIYREDEEIAPEQISNLIHLKNFGFMVNEERPDGKLFPHMVINGVVYTPQDVLHCLISRSANDTYIVHQGRVYHPLTFKDEFLDKPIPDFDVTIKNETIPKEHLPKYIDLPEQPILTTVIPTQLYITSPQYPELSETTKHPTRIGLSGEGEAYFTPDDDSRIVEIVESTKDSPTDEPTVTEATTLRTSIATKTTELPTLFPYIVFNGSVFNPPEVVEILRDQNPENVTIVTDDGKEFTPEAFAEYYIDGKPKNFAIYQNGKKVEPVEIPQIVRFHTNNDDGYDFDYNEKGHSTEKPYETTPFGKGTYYPRIPSRPDDRVVIIDEPYQKDQESPDSSSSMPSSESNDEEAESNQPKNEYSPDVDRSTYFPTEPANAEYQSTKAPNPYSGTKEDDDSDEFIGNTTPQTTDIDITQPTQPTKPTIPPFYSESYTSEPEVPDSASHTTRHAIPNVKPTPNPHGDRIVEYGPEDEKYLSDMEDSNEKPTPTSYDLVEISQPTQPSVHIPGKPEMPIYSTPGLIPANEKPTVPGIETFIPPQRPTRPSREYIELVTLPPTAPSKIVYEIITDIPTRRTSTVSEDQSYPSIDVSDFPSKPKIPAESYSKSPEGTKSPDRIVEIYQSSSKPVEYPMETSSEDEPSLELYETLPEKPSQPSVEIPSPPTRPPMYTGEISDMPTMPIHNTEFNTTPVKPPRPGRPSGIPGRPTPPLTEEFVEISQPTQPSISLPDRPSMPTKPTQGQGEIITRPDMPSQPSWSPEYPTAPSAEFVEVSRPSRPPGYSPEIPSMPTRPTQDQGEIITRPDMPSQPSYPSRESIGPSGEFIELTQPTRPPGYSPDIPSMPTRPTQNQREIITRPDMPSQPTWSGKYPTPPSGEFIEITQPTRPPGYSPDIPSMPTRPTQNQGEIITRPDMPSQPTWSGKYPTPPSGEFIEITQPTRPPGYTPDIPNKSTRPTQNQGEIITRPDMPSQPTWSGKYPTPPSGEFMEISQPTRPPGYSPDIPSMPTRPTQNQREIITRPDMPSQPTWSGKYPTPPSGEFIEITQPTRPPGYTPDIPNKSTRPTQNQGEIITRPDMPSQPTWSGKYPTPPSGEFVEISQPTRPPGYSPDIPSMPTRPTQDQGEIITRPDMPSQPTWSGKYPTPPSGEFMEISQPTRPPGTSPDIPSMPTRPTQNQGEIITRPEMPSQPTWSPNYPTPPSGEFEELSQPSHPPSYSPGIPKMPTQPSLNIPENIKQPSRPTRPPGEIARTRYPPTRPTPPSAGYVEISHPTRPPMYFPEEPEMPSKPSVNIPDKPSLADVVITRPDSFETNQPSEEFNWSEQPTLPPNYPTNIPGYNPPSQPENKPNHPGIEVPTIPTTGVTMPDQPIWSSIESQSTPIPPDMVYIDVTKPTYPGYPPQFNTPRKPKWPETYPTRPTPSIPDLGSYELNTSPSYTPEEYKPPGHGYPPNYTPKIPGYQFSTEPSYDNEPRPSRIVEISDSSNPQNYNTAVPETPIYPGTTVGRPSQELNIQSSTPAPHKHDLIIRDGDVLDEADIIRQLTLNNPDNIQIRYNGQTYKPDQFIHKFPTMPTDMDVEYLINGTTVPPYVVAARFPSKTKPPKNETFPNVMKDGVEYTPEDVMRELAKDPEGQCVEVIYDGKLYTPRQFFKTFGNKNIFPTNFQMQVSGKTLDPKVFLQIFKVLDSDSAEKKSALPTSGSLELTSTRPKTDLISTYIRKVMSKEPNFEIVYQGTNYKPLEYIDAFGGPPPDKFKILYMGRLMSPKQFYKYLKSSHEREVIDGSQNIQQHFPEITFEGAQYSPRLVIQTLAVNNPNNIRVKYSGQIYNPMHFISVFKKLPNNFELIDSNDIIINPLETWKYLGARAVIGRKSLSTENDKFPVIVSNGEKFTPIEVLKNIAQQNANVKVKLTTGQEISAQQALRMRPLPVNFDLIANGAKILPNDIARMIELQKL